MRFVMAHSAGEGVAFAPGAFDRQIGRDIPLNLGSIRQTGTLRAAEVSTDRRTVYLTIEVEDRSPIAAYVRAGLQPGAFGIGGELHPYRSGGPSGTDGHQGSPDSW